MAGLSRLVRQICLLREEGDAAEATRLQEQDLALAVAEVRRARGADALPDNVLVALFERETQRVTEALLTAEILIERLTQRWAPLAGTAAPVREPGASRVLQPLRPTVAAPATGSANPPVITDLLDAMLASERPSTRLSPARNS
jgi:hypothetical protein